jgi:hypothetical protein
MNDKEYIKELETMVSNHLTSDGYEWFYWDILPQSTKRTREAYYRCTGDSRFLNDDD